MGRRLVTAGLVAASALVGSCGGDDRHVEPLPRSMCSQLVTARGVQPGLLIVADLPTRGRVGSSGAAMAQAMRLTFERHGFRAGEHRLALQICDDSTARADQVDVERCAANGKAYAANRAVVGVIGPIHSVCAEALVPETEPSTLAVISPSATSIKLTRPQAGQPAVPGRTSARRAFFRVIAPDDEQANVAVSLARRLGAHRLFIVAEASGYGQALRLAADRAARAAGMRILGPAFWDADGRRAQALAREVRVAGADAAILSGTWQEGGAELAAALRSELGQRFPIIASEGFLLGLPPQAARAADRIWITVPGVPAARLPAAGRRIVAAAGAGQAPFISPPLAAQAAELLLAAIARSDGTRGDVTRQLRRVRLTDGPIGAMSFDAFGDPVPRRITLYRVRGSTPLPVG